MAHLEDEDRMMVYLVIDEVGTIQAICRDCVVAHLSANASGSDWRVETSMEGFYQLGQHLPLFHS
jgi:hypothetical protein